MEKQAKKLNKDIVFPSVIIFTILVLLLFVCPFSPIHRYCFETDEIAYRVVSKGLLKGKIPYRDLFDHKGPLLYFVYALGMLITGGSDIGTSIASLSSSLNRRAMSVPMWSASMLVALLSMLQPNELA